MYSGREGEAFEVTRGLREVIPNQTGYIRHREYTVHTGGVLSTLQDIKLPDTAGGYVYSNPEGSPLLANRTLYWRTMGDVLELSEVSLNYNLVMNKVLYRFQDSPLLDGISVHESWGQIVVLVPTVTSVHRLSFPHPNKLEQSGLSRTEGDGLMSVLSEANVSTAREYQHLIPCQSAAPLSHIAASYFTHDEESVFVLGNSQGQLTCVKMGQVRGMTSVTQLATPGNYLGRVWTSLTRAADTRDQPMSLVIAPVNGIVMLVCVCRDHKLRVWNLATGDCISATDLVSFLAEAGREMVQGTQAHKVSVVHQDKNDELVVCLFLCFQQHSQFLNLGLSYRAGQLNVAPQDTLYCPEFDLVGFSATARGIAAVWTTSEGETIVRRSVKGGGPGWETVTLVDSEPDLMDLESEDDDPRQVYLGALFSPGVFKATTLARTTGIFRRNLENNTISEDTSWDQLKREVVLAVEEDIKSSLTDYEVTDEEYLSISRAAWTRFYSCAAQYRAAGSQPMGLVTSNRENTILIVRKNVISWCRPVEALEQVVISRGSGVTTDVFHDVPLLSDEPSLSADVLNLLQAAGMIGRLLPGSATFSFREAVFRQQSPDLVSRNLAADLLADQEQPHELEKLLSRIQQVQDLTRAMEIVMYCLELDSGSVSRGELDLGKIDADEPSPKVFSSDLGTSLVAESLRQQVDSRLGLSQHLLVLQHVLIDCSATARVSPSVLDSLQSTFLPRTTVMVHCYNLLTWLAQVPASRPLGSVEELTLRQLAVLRLQDKSSSIVYKDDKASNSSLLELFLEGPGRVVRVAVGESRGEDCWSRALPPITNMTAQLLWPRCASPTFLNFLLRSSQHQIVQNYCRMLSTWCDWHPYARQFLLGASLLNMGEEEKALDLFISAVGGVPQDRFLTVDLLDLQGETQDDLTVDYFIKVVSLLEQLPCPDLVISLTETARAVCPQDHKERATLSYILFSYHLKLGHNEDAYAAMMSNPDSTRRKDSLRQFLVTLFDRGELSQLASYPYTDMIEEVESIIESRARSADLSVNNYYDFLYSFHVSKENFRKAAQVMYECGSRLGNELCNLEGLKKQVQSLLSCINCLYLVSPKYQWLIKPCPVPATSPKRFLDGSEKMEEVEAQGMEVVELSDIKKELVVSQARLKLTVMAGTSQGSLPASPGLTPAETVGFLTTANLYLSAVQICCEFSLELTGVIEALASKAVRLSTGKPQEKSAAWLWLAENRPGGLDIQGDCAVAATWSLLQHLVTSQEKAGETVLHRVAVLRLFSLGAVLPPWLVAGYKKRDCAELCRLYHAQGQLEAATDLIIEYLEAVQGHGGEYFGLQHSLQANTRPAWVPWTVLDRLFLELSDNSNNSTFSKCLNRLDASVEKYLGTVQRTTRDMIASKS